MNFKAIKLPEYGTYLYESRHTEGDVVHVHYHDIHQILYAIDGKGTITIDGQQHHINQDHAALIVPKSEHSIHSHSGLTLLVLAFDLQSLGNFIDHQFNDAFLHTSQVIMPDLIASSELRQYLRKMLNEQASEDQFSGWALKIHLLHILLTMIRLKERTQIQDHNSLRTETIKKFIDTYYYESLTLSDIATRLGISSRYVNTIFKEQYHLTPIQYLTEVRIERAKKLLTETDKEIITICFEVGYETLSTFYRAFKNTTNMSPNQYRMMINKSI